MHSWTNLLFQGRTNLNWPSSIQHLLSDLFCPMRTVEVLWWFALKNKHKFESVKCQIVGRMMSFTTFLAAPPAYIGIVDVRDVAYAHVKVRLPFHLIVRWILQIVIALIDHVFWQAYTSVFGIWKLQMCKIVQRTLKIILVVAIIRRSIDHAFLCQCRPLENHDNIPVLPVVTIRSLCANLTKRRVKRV